MSTNFVFTINSDFINVPKNLEFRGKNIVILTQNVLFAIPSPPRKIAAFRKKNYRNHFILYYKNKYSYKFQAIATKKYLGSISENVSLKFLRNVGIFSADYS